MRLNEIINDNDRGGSSILIESLLPYKKSLLTYYKALFCCDPVLMVVSVSNAAQYGKIVPSNDFNEAVCDWLNVPFVAEPGEDGYDEDLYGEFETINFNSVLLSQL